MDILKNLLGGPQQQQDHQDFVNRYQQSPQSISGQEAATRYQQVAPQLPPDVYRQAAQDAFAQMSPEERAQFGQQLIQQARQQGYTFPDVNQDGIDDRLQDPNQLAQMTTHMHQQQPGLLNQVFGGGGAPNAGGGFTGSTLGKVAMGGIAAYGLSRVLGGGLFGGGGHGGGGLFGGGGHGGGFFGGGHGEED